MQRFTVGPSITGVVRLLLLLQLSCCCASGMLELLGWALSQLLL
jgi:hypothetical protein